MAKCDYKKLVFILVFLQKKLTKKIRSGFSPTGDSQVVDNLAVVRKNRMSILWIAIFPKRIRLFYLIYIDNFVASLLPNSRSPD